MNNLVTIFLMGMIALTACVILSFQLSHAHRQVAELSAQMEFLKQESARAQIDTNKRRDFAVNNLKIRQRSLDSIMRENVANDCHAAAAWALRQKERIK